MKRLTNYQYLSTFGILILMLVPSFIFNSTSSIHVNETLSHDSLSAVHEISHQAYDGNFSAKNFVETMTIQPIITPDNGEDTLVTLIDSANSSIDLELQYIRLFNSSSDENWSTDENPLVQALVRAISRGVKVRVILNAEADTDNASVYLTSVGAEVRFLDLAPGGDLPSWNHNKGIIIDNKTVAISSINWSKTSLRRNREAGVILHESTNIARYFLDVFDYDWERSQTAFVGKDLILNTESRTILRVNEEFQENDKLWSESAFEASKFSGTFNVTTYVGPDSTYDTVFKYLDAAKNSIHVEIYSISLTDIVDKLITLKEANPSLDIKIIISDWRASYYENINTWAQALRLVENGIAVYNSSNQFTYQHAKFWIIDGKHSFVYSGNWALSSMPADPSYSNANREWGVVINSQEVSNYYEQVFQNDLTIAEPFKPDLLASNKIIGLMDGSILSGTRELKIVGQNISQVTLNIDDMDLVNMTVSADGKSATHSLDTTVYQNGIHVLSFNITSTDGISEMLNITVNIINNEPKWKLLITEILYDAENEPEEEFIEITNLFDFPLAIDNWKIIDLETTNKTFIFPSGTQLNENQGLIITRDATAFLSKFGFLPSFEHDQLSLRNTGDEVLLESAEGILRDAVVWGSGESIPGVKPFTGDPGNGESIQRTPIFQDTDDCDADFTIGTPDPRLIVTITETQTQPTTSSTPSTKTSATPSSTPPPSSSESNETTNATIFTDTTPVFTGLETITTLAFVMFIILTVRRRKQRQ